MVPPFHWWRTVFFLIPAIGVYTIVLGHAVDRLGLSSGGADGSPTAARALWSWLILATTGVRVHGARPRPRAAGPVYLFVSQPPEHLRHPDHLLERCRSTCASSRRRRSGGFPFIGGTCGAPVTCSWTAPSPSSSVFRQVAELIRARGQSLLVFPEGTRSRDGRVGQVPRRASSCWPSRRGWPSSRSPCGSRHVMPRTG